MRNKMIFFLCMIASSATGQLVPSADENIPCLVTFGREAETSYGDDDFSQVFFCVIPRDQMSAIYIRVYDPDIGNTLDELIGEANTKCRFEIYGGNGTISAKNVIKESPSGNYKSGILLGSKIFDNKKDYDGKWYTFGPFNPLEGEMMEEYGGYIFKIIAEGISGNDGNQYKYFLSSNPTENIPVEGSNFFTFEYTFVLNAAPNSVSHIYPYMDKNVVAIKINTFDFDSDGHLRIVSIGKKGEMVSISGENEWVTSRHIISDEEKKTSLDIQIIKTSGAKNNNMVFFITNQYGELMPFYTVPIGGIPKYKYKIAVKR
ncbi:MAG TPA: hypothetical protein VNW99_04185 [Cytophagaceae bacterium]|jgi:hypothetical protein|nr:hypothetical protein [Cytophagaceae bacterium]